MTANLEENGKLIQAIEDLTDEFNAAYLELEDQYRNKLEALKKEWAAKHRKYADGFTFPYKEETAKITGASVGGVWLDKTAEGDYDVNHLNPHSVYIVYTCYVPSWCEADIINIGRIGDRPNKGICITEKAIDQILELPSVAFEEDYTV